jgi:hypothetical protein
MPANEGFDKKVPGEFAAIATPRWHGSANLSLNISTVTPQQMNAVRPFWRPERRN